MAEFLREHSQEYWRQAPTPQNDLKTGVPQSVGNRILCASCGNPYATGARFCHCCGSGRESDLRVEKRRLRLDWLDFDRARELTGLSTIPLALALCAGLFMLASVMTGLIYDTSTIAEWQAVQTWKAEWLLATVAALLAALLFKKP